MTVGRLTARAYDRGKAETIRDLWATYRQAVGAAENKIATGDDAGARARLDFAAGVRQEIDNLIAFDAASGSAAHRHPMDKK